MPRGRRLYSALAVKRPLLVAFVVLAVVVFLAGLLVFAFYSLLRFQPRTELATPGILVVNLDGLVVERAQEDVFLAGFEGAQHELLDLAMALDRATEDDRIAGVYLRIGSPGMGWAKAEELRRRLLEFRESGKFVYAYTPFTDELGYYIALAADELYVLPGAGLEMNGFRVETPFIHQLLDKIGLEAQVEAVGAYKSAADVLARDNMSEPDREVTTALLQERYRGFVDAVVEARGTDRARLTAALDQGVYLLRDLEALGLIDGEAHEPDVQRMAVAAALEMDPEAVERNEVADHLIDVLDYVGALPEPEETPVGAVALVYAVGAIVRGESGFDPLFGRVMGSSTMVATLQEVARDEEVEAVVVRIDSPGGDALASEEIWAAIEALNERVPVVVSMGDVAASGGYYMASAADVIVAEPSTLTGSIGVLAVLFDASELYRRIGITWDMVETNPAADFPTSTRPLTPEERQTFRLLVEDFYRTFVERVAEGRDRPVPEIEQVAQGRVWSGAQALEVGLVDTTGGLETALAVAKERAGIDPEARVWLHVYPREQTWIERVQQVLRLRGTTRAEPGVRERVARMLVQDLGAALPAVGAALRGGPGRPLAVMPYVPSIR
jgi:protease-4